MPRLAGCLVLIAGVLVSFVTPVSAGEYTIWHSARDLGPSGSGVSVAPGSPTGAMEISFTATGARWVQMPLTVPATVNITGVQICYQLSDAATPLSQIRVSEMTTPDAASVRIDDPTDRTSTTPECVISGPYSKSFDGTLTLVLRVDVSDISHTVEIGGVGIIVDDGLGAAPEPMAIPEGE